MHWDYKDQLRQTDLGGGGTAFYVYDASGQRVRKVWEKSPGLTEERIYLGGFEIFRKHGGPIGANTATLERETLHVMDDKQRIALVETRTLDTAGNDPAPRQLIRYQFGNHLGSASLELDEQAQIISYEEYPPYGSTSYQAVRSQTETPKRYRYTGKERDEESGFYYHGARYYAAWLGRWVSADPAFLTDGLNLYNFTRANPITLTDLTGTDSKNTLLDDLTGVIYTRHRRSGLNTIEDVGDEYSNSIVSMFVTLGEQSHSSCSNRVSKLKLFDLGVDIFAQRYDLQAQFANAASQGSAEYERANAAQIIQHDDYYIDSSYNVRSFVGTKQQHEDFVNARNSSRNLMPRIVGDVMASAYGGRSSGGGGRSSGGGGRSSGRGGRSGGESQHGAPLKAPSITGSPSGGGSGGRSGGSPGAGGSSSISPEGQWVGLYRNKAEADAARNTIDLIHGRPSAYPVQGPGGPGSEKWGSIFKNTPPFKQPGRLPELPQKLHSYYSEHYVKLPGQTAPGALRLVTGFRGEMYSSWTHYGQEQPWVPLDPNAALPRVPFLRIK